MAKHTPAYVDGDIATSNRVMAEWLNEVNTTVYDILGNGTDEPATRAIALTNLGFSAYVQTLIGAASAAAAAATLVVLPLAGGTMTGPIVLSADPEAPLQPVSLRSLGGYIDGLRPSNNAGDPDNDIDIAVGTAIDTTRTYLMRLSAGVTKRIDATWAAGTNQGGLFSGVSLAVNTLYYVHLIRNDSTGATDIGFDTSKTAANKPAGYTYYRRVGSIYTKSAATTLRGFRIIGDTVFYTDPVGNVNISNLGNTRQLLAVSVPPSMTGIFRGYFYNSGSVAKLILQPAFETDASPVGNQSPGISLYAEVANQGAAGEFLIPADSSSQIAARADIASCNLCIITRGWVEDRATS